LHNRSNTLLEIQETGGKTLESDKRELRQTERKRENKMSQDCLLKQRGCSRGTGWKKKKKNPNILVQKKKATREKKEKRKKAGSFTDPITKEVPGGEGTRRTKQNNLIQR